MDDDDLKLARETIRQLQEDWITYGVNRVYLYFDDGSRNPVVNCKELTKDQNPRDIFEEFKNRYESTTEELY